MNHRYLLLLPLVFLFSCGPTPISINPSNNANCFCADSTRSDSLCSEIPHEVPIFSFVGYQSVLSPLKQPPFDIFSWQSFVALNWPADANGNPKNVPIGSDNSSLRVWENYVLADTVFIKTGGTAMHLTLLPKDAKTKKRLFNFSKFTDNININNQFFEADGSVLIDKNLNYVLYEERINKDEWNYIDSNQLRTESGQQTFITVSNIDLPSGYYGAGHWGNPTSGPVGAMEIKASWRILDPKMGDDTTRYYHQTAEISIAGQYTWSGNPLHFTAIVGLVGMHIIHKTGKFDREIWSTFEHIDNVPDNPQQAQNDQKQYSFYNPQCLNLPVNTKPPVVNGKQGMWNDTAPFAKEFGVEIKGEGSDKKYGTQVSRVYPIYFTTDSINQIFQAKLAGTVWANYRLVGTQWFLQGDAPPMDTVPNAPVLLGNTTLETYIQPTASCITCHGFATIAGTPKDSTNVRRYHSDFSFLFAHAASASAELRQPTPTPSPAKKPK